ncbi:hypothetical protein M3Y99_01218700 [Aphelenchoides fujianensis]|nr:hypothetical protein M3Y99_01218700 [Aphelenchoides fujianensis]
MAVVHLLSVLLVLVAAVCAQSTNEPIPTTPTRSQPPALGADGKPRPHLGEAMVAAINRGMNRTFMARRYDRFENRTRTELKGFLGSAFEASANRSKRAAAEPPVSASLPTSFDARKKWTKCAPMIGRIPDQSQCGSCYAVSTVSVIQDRRCIRFNGTAKPPISAWDVVSCCPTCRADPNNGCNAGYVSEVFKWFNSEGIVSGGHFGGGGCKPYPVSPQALSAPATTACSKTCQRAYKAATYPKDKKKGRVYRMFYQENAVVMNEIMTNGPIVAAFDVYEDFYQYSSGIYQHVTRDLMGRHAVRVIRWGRENGVDFWLVANSWSTSWGEGGFFRIRRGTDECGFESRMMAGSVYLM